MCPLCFETEAIIRAGRVAVNQHVSYAVNHIVEFWEHRVPYTVAPANCHYCGAKDCRDVHALLIASILELPGHETRV